MLNCKWEYKPLGDADAAAALAKSLQVNKTISNLLVQRGVYSFEEAKQFFRPQLSDLHDPFLMKDMNKAIDRISRALFNNEKILILGDYDVDGTTAVALVYDFFHYFYYNIDFYIPDRYTEGYGISFQSIDFASQNNFSLIITLDCGIKAYDKIAYANSKNIDVIVCDHHLPDDELPPAYAILNPKQPDCAYPFKELSGCGIGFKLLQAYCQKFKETKTRIYNNIDLVAVSIAADIVPLTGENRTLAYFGLHKLNTEPQIGIKTILQTHPYNKKEMEISDLVFYVGPRLNAAGRISNGRKAVELLLAKSQEEANEKFEEINKQNDLRRDLDKNITQQAIEMITNDSTLLERKTTVIFQKDWHKGVVGIVASRLTNQFYKPTIVLTESNGLVTGSVRSVKNFDVYEAIEACSDLLEQFGGHKYAAGLTLKPENLERFQERFEEVVSKIIKDEHLIPTIEIDLSIELTDIDAKLFRILKQFAPFGPENMRPVFATEGLTAKNVHLVGNNNNHLKFTAQKNNIEFNAIAFDMADYFLPISNGSLFSLAYTIDMNNFDQKIQLIVKDIKILS